MKFEVKTAIAAPIEHVWNFLLDHHRLAPCVPGCENVVSLDNNSYEIIEVVRIGPISARFNLNVTILEMTPPRYLSVAMEGKDSRTASLTNAKAIINLEQGANSKTTQLHYILLVTLTGILARFGEGMIRKKANILATQFAENLRSQLESS